MIVALGAAFGPAGWRVRAVRNAGLRPGVGRMLVRRESLLAQAGSG